MASLPHTYTDALADNRPAAASIVATPYARTDGPRSRLPASSRYERNERSSHERRGSHMPIDTAIHWEWSNPLNILPALILVFMVVAVIAMVLA